MEFLLIIYIFFVNICPLIIYEQEIIVYSTVRKIYLNNYKKIGLGK